MTVINRKTNETDIKCEFLLNENNGIEVNTGIGFLDHMLELMAFHGRFSLKLKAVGDLYVDDHHLVEDVGIVIGECLKAIIKENKGMNRYGSMLMPMDEVLSQIVIDCSGRSVLIFNCKFIDSSLGCLSSQNIKEFFKAVVDRSQITLHMTCLYGENDHHKAESFFKGFGQVLNKALSINGEKDFSTKGVLL